MLNHREHRGHRAVRREAMSSISQLRRTASGVKLYAKIGTNNAIVPETMSDSHNPQRICGRRRLLGGLLGTLLGGLFGRGTSPAQAASSLHDADVHGGEPLTTHLRR